MSGPALTVTMIGMPSTGKSTYLAALYQALIEPPLASSARLARQPSTRAYLMELREAWLKGEKLGRTLRDSGELVELDVTFPGREEMALAIPDIAGESFGEVFATRQADELATSLVRNAQGILLFTHPDQQRPRVPIAALKRMQALLGEVGPVPGDEEERQFDAKLLPGEVQLVDLLQWAVRVREPQSERHRVALVVSAWDKIDERLSPSTWLAAKMPMLQSFADTHSEILEVRPFGVCAQGGDYDLEPVADRRPRERAYVVSPDGTREHDITAPLQWAALT